MRLAFLFFVPFCLAGNILVLNPTTGHSHVRFLGNLASLLADDGHNVTVLSPVVDSSVKPFGTENPKVRKIIYYSPYVDTGNWQKLDMKQPTFWNSPPSQGLSMDWSVWTAFTQTTANLYRGMLEDEVFMQSLIDEKYDLGVLKIFEIGGIGLFEVLGIRANMAAAALGMVNFHYEITGIPFFSSFVPDWMTTFGEEMTFFERIENMRADYEMELHTRKHLETLHAMFRNYTPSFPDLREIMKNKVGVILVNANEFAESPRPRSNMLQYVGGTNVHPPQPLADDIEEILAKSSSAVLFSLGSFVYSCSMPLEMKMEILNSFVHFPNHTFLWKYEECENDMTPFDEYPNVIRRAWWPQTDLLGHPRIKAFITHAGMNSILEVAFRGKPTITIPLFGDQYINAKNAVARGLSVIVDRTNITEENLTAALHQILDPGSRIAEKAALAADVLEGKDEEYRQAVLRWARLLIKHGPLEHLPLPTRRMSFVQIYSLDIFAFVVVLGLVTLSTVYFLVRHVIAAVSKTVKEKST